MLSVVDAALEPGKTRLEATGLAWARLGRHALDTVAFAGTLNKDWWDTYAVSRLPQEVDVLMQGVQPGLAAFEPFRNSARAIGQRAVDAEVALVRNGWEVARFWLLGGASAPAVATAAAPFEVPVVEAVVVPAAESAAEPAAEPVAEPALVEAAPVAVVVEPAPAEAPAEAAAAEAVVPDAVTAEADVAEEPAPGLLEILGIGPKLLEKLEAAGVTELSQLAAFGADEIEALDQRLALRGRSIRDNWVGQAKALLEG